MLASFKISAPIEAVKNPLSMNFSRLHSRGPDTAPTARSTGPTSAGFARLRGPVIVNVRRLGTDRRLRG
jgi:hypothetical protein